MHLHIYTYTYTYAYAYAYSHSDTQAGVQRDRVRERTYIHTYTHTYIHAYLHTYIYTYTHRDRERERITDTQGHTERDSEREKHKHTHICTYIHMHQTCTHTGFVQGFCKVTQAQPGSLIRCTCQVWKVNCSLGNTIGHEVSIPGPFNDLMLTVALTPFCNRLSTALMLPQSIRGSQGLPPSLCQTITAPFNLLPHIRTSPMFSTFPNTKVKIPR